MPKVIPAPQCSHITLSTGNQMPRAAGEPIEYYFFSLFIFSGVKFSYWGLLSPRLAGGTNFRPAEAPGTERRSLFLTAVIF